MDHILLLIMLHCGRPIHIETIIQGNSLSRQKKKSTGHHFQPSARCVLSVNDQPFSDRDSAIAPQQRFIATLPLFVYSEPEPKRPDSTCLNREICWGGVFNVYI